MGDLFKGAIFGGLLATVIGSLGLLMINSRYERVCSDNESLRSKITNSVPLEERSLDGKRWYLLNLEGKVLPGSYNLTTEESDVCSIIADNVKVKSGNYKLMFIEQINSPIDLKPMSEPKTFSPLRSEENIPYSISGTNKLDPAEAKKLGLAPEEYIVRPHPYKEGNFIFIKEKDSEKFEMPYKTSLKTLGPNGDVYYHVEVRDSKGNLLQEYIEPSNEKYEKNPDYEKRQFYSTTPIISNPDGSMDAYRPLKEGETLEDVMRKGPVDKYVPSAK